MSNPVEQMLILGISRPEQKDIRRANTEHCPEGMKTGEVIHYDNNGNTQLMTDASIDPAGNVWYADNWDIATAVADIDPARADATKAGGDGVAVLFGLAAPVETPLMGPVRTPRRWPLVAKGRCRVVV